MNYHIFNIGKLVQVKRDVFLSPNTIVHGEGVGVRWDFCRVSYMGFVVDFIDRFNTGFVAVGSIKESPGNFYRVLLPCGLCWTRTEDVAFL